MTSAVSYGANARMEGRLQHVPSLHKAQARWWFPTGIPVKKPLSGREGMPGNGVSAPSESRPLEKESSAGQASARLNHRTQEVCTNVLRHTHRGRGVAVARFPIGPLKFQKEHVHLWGRKQTLIAARLPLSRSSLLIPIWPVWCGRCISLKPTEFWLQLGQRIRPVTQQKSDLLWVSVELEYQNKWALGCLLRYVCHNKNVFLVQALPWEVLERLLTMQV